MSKDVAALLREAIKALSMKAAVERVEGDGAFALGIDYAVGQVRPLIPPHAILIDPTAPETVAALAWALDDPSVTDDELGPEEAERWAAAILPAFVARLRGET
jgi:hypothetical protein